MKRPTLVVLLLVLCLSMLSPTISLVIHGHGSSGAAWADPYEGVDNPDGRWNVFLDWWMMLLYKMGEKVAQIFA